MSWILHYIPSSTTVVWLPFPSSNQRGFARGSQWSQDHKRNHSIHFDWPQYVQHLLRLLSPPYNLFLPEFLWCCPLFSFPNLTMQTLFFCYFTNQLTHRNNMIVYNKYLYLFYMVDFGYFSYLTSLLNHVILLFKFSQIFSVNNFACKL